MKEKYYAVFILFFFCYAACGKKEEPNTTITGKWKLVETRSMVTVDHSKDRIIYEFKADGSLHIAHRSGAPSWGPGEGEHAYDFYDEDTTSWQGYSLFGNLTIGERTYGCYLSPDKMVIVDNPALDGPLVYFKRE
ncbi:hypothetical protein [Negadavirga shengliensis]|uniref:Lipocalin-like domain-containing protein n=1 Tax=Negadavirga shengliensis TaxID=1389218 RepID=A0ABV9T2K3_9BACT